MIFFAFHQYLTTYFQVNNFLLGIIFLSYLLLEMMYQYIFFKYFTRYPYFYFLQMFMLCKRRSHNLIVISFCEGVRLQQLRKTKYSPLASILHIFLFFSFFSYRALYLLHGFFISCFESENIFQKMLLFGKIHFVIPFWSRSERTNEN